MNERLRKIRPCRIVSLVHHLRSSEPAYRWQRRLYRAVEARYLASVDGHVCISRDTLRCVQELAGTKVPSIIAYPGKDKLASFSAAEIVAARPEQDGTRTILFLGNVIPRKGLHILIHALSRVSGKWRLEVVGSLSQARGYVHAVFRQAIRLGLVERISFFGVLSDADLAERFRRSHILAVPSLHEGFGIVYLEALGWGVPVIASRSGGAREIVRQEKDGFLVDPKNIPELTRSLQALVNDRSLLARMSMNALERYTHFLTWEQSASNIRQFLESLTMKQKTISQGKSRVNDYACAGSCSK
jgi:glycosyltransferase involved in cell wall biosynthesis